MARRDRTQPRGLRKMGYDGASASAVASFTNYVYTYDPDTGLPIATILARIGCKLTQMSPLGTSTSTNYLKGDTRTRTATPPARPERGWRLSMDGCRVWWKDDLIPVDQPWTNNGSFSLTISIFPPVIIPSRLIIMIFGASHPWVACTVRTR